MSFKQIVGQDKAVKFLKLSLSSERLSPALLFAGPAGVGKRRTARELAKALNCTNLASPLPSGRGAGGEGFESCDVCDNCRRIEEGNHPEVMEIDFAKQAEWLEEKAEKQTAIKIEIVRMVDRQAGLKSSEGGFRVVVFDPAQELTDEAANALLKLLEEPPPRFLIILIAEDESSLLPTIRSRCAVVRFGRIAPADIVRHLTTEGGLPPDQAEEIARSAGGSFERAEWEKEWAGWQAPALEEMDLVEAFKWIEQEFDPRKGGRNAAQKFAEILIQKECDQLSLGALASHEKLRALLTTSAALRQNVSPRLALEALYLRLKRIKRNPGSLRAAASVMGEDD